ncbi:MAG TPA: hypothetical protein PKJ94_07075 [Ferruginibacter sp.]|nr:hypothetical protein [Ferruginibacter sp.]
MAGILFKWLMVGGFLLPNPTPAEQVLHPIYVSVTEIEHNSKDKTLEISCKIFTDDFEKALRQQFNTHVDLLNPKEKAAMEKLVSTYVLKHLLVRADGKPLALQYLGYEQQEEGIVSFYQATNIPSVKKIEVTDNILFEYKKEQISLLHVIVNGNRKSTKLVNPEEKAGFEF